MLLLEVVNIISSTYLKYKMYNLYSKILKTVFSRSYITASAMIGDSGDPPTQGDPKHLLIYFFPKCEICGCQNEFDTLYKLILRYFSIFCNVFSIQCIFNLSLIPLIAKSKGTFIKSETITINLFTR